MIQVELTQGRKTMVGFVKDKMAKLESILTIGKDNWTVTSVYSHQPSQLVAWSFKAEEAGVTKQ